MKVHNFLPLLLECLQEWETLPPKAVFEQRYCKPMEKWLRPLFADLHSRFGCGFYSLLEGLEWGQYREEALKLDAHREQVRVYKYLALVEKLLGVKLEGEVLLFGGFTMVDGYARFDEGSHCVYLGVDESHGRGGYLDVLMAHELTHVARESIAGIWEGFDLNPKMSHDDFVENQPVIEHLFAEGFSCVVSELLVPSNEPWHYIYQTEDTLAQIMKHGPALDRVIHRMVVAQGADYHDLYDVSIYRPPLPRYAHYVWAWRWVSDLLKTHGEGDVRKLLPLCSKRFLRDALAFQLVAEKKPRRKPRKKSRRKATKKPVKKASKRRKPLARAK
jgi:hypothetical protein